MNMRLNTSSTYRQHCVARAEHLRREAVRLIVVGAVGMHLSPSKEFIAEREAAWTQWLHWFISSCARKDLR